MNETVTNDTTKTWLGRLTGWCKKQKRIDRDWPLLPYHVHTRLITEYKLTTEDVSNLRCVYVGGWRLRHNSSVSLLIFNVVEARAQGITVTDFRDLQRHPDLVRFRARLYKGKVAYMRRVRDRLSPPVGDPDAGLSA